MKKIILSLICFCSFDLGAKELIPITPISPLPGSEVSIQCENFDESLSLFDQWNQELYGETLDYLKQLKEVLDSWATILEPIAKNGEKYTFPQDYFSPMQMTVRTLKESFANFEEKSFLISDLFWSNWDNINMCVKTSKKEALERFISDFESFGEDFADLNNLENTKLFGKFVVRIEKMHLQYMQMEGHEVHVPINTFDSIWELSRTVEISRSLIQENVQLVQGKYLNNIKRLKELGSEGLPSLP